MVEAIDKTAENDGHQRKSSAGAASGEESTEAKDDIEGSGVCP